MIVLKNASKIYKGDYYSTVALDNVNFEVHDGDFVAIQGESGSGKSTLLNIIGCMDGLTNGTLLVEDIEASGLKPIALDRLRKKYMSYIFQNYELMNNFTVYENIELPLNVQKLSRAQKKKKIEQIMDRLGIVDLKSKYPNQISGGEKQRAAIARAYVANKKYILADEPTGALDRTNTDEIMKIFKQLNEEGKTIIMVTHDDYVAGFAAKIVRIKDGRLF